MRRNIMKMTMVAALVFFMSFGIVGCSSDDQKTSKKTTTETQNIDNMSEKEKKELSDDLEESKVDGMNVTNDDGEILTSKKEIEKFTQELIKKYEPLADGKKLYCSPGTHACIDDDGNIYTDDSGKPEKWTPVKGQYGTFTNANGDETDNSVIMKPLELARERGHKENQTS
ncbi:MAG: hypothetical protein PUE27_10730 [Sharpea porci]|uniref:hypothetical protein n=1 Tax=Sharpea porci TaxID=2652286 RepID=UPI00240A1686|nr:hypothetical protein [Sharpea porci]MDD6712538.1 hypothetical protein [Sharpea porci]